MANSITSEITISTAVSTLQNMLAPLSNFTLDISSDVVGRQSVVKVPIVDTDDGARTYSAGTGYTSNSDSDVSTVSVNVNEEIKPFHLNDNDMNRSPLTIQNYAQQNANEFGRYLLNKLYATVQAGVDANPATVTNSTAVAVEATAIASIKALHADLDDAGANMNRSLLLGAGASNSLMPSTIETFGNSVVESGRFSQLYGMNVSVTNAHGTLAAGDVHTIACPSDAIVVVNRVPDTSGSATLEEFTPFTIDGLGLQCAYRRFYDASKGIHYGAFTTMFGLALAKPSQIAVLLDA
jgi:hypothetical protein